MQDVELAEPGGTRVFGNMTVSHDLIHLIGGEDDTNQNTTRRVLLLLESRPVGPGDAYQRVVQQVLARYVNEGDTTLLTDDGRNYKVPRFLLNDVVRFWRTMAVDFASKQREQAGKKWGIRNIKLRMSRKLIFASGLLVCLGCRLQAVPKERSADELVAFLVDRVSLTPLEILAQAFLDYGPLEAARDTFDAYDSFLGRLSDEPSRRRLENLGVEESNADELFRELHDLSRRFQGGLSTLFFGRHDALRKLTQEYGVF